MTGVQTCALPILPTSAPAAPKDKRRAILLAAAELFSRYGFRKTSLDLLAAEASVAKPTIYAYFADKEALFVSVCELLVSDIAEATHAAAAEPGALTARISAMLAAKFTKIFELVHTSPHARELLNSKDALAAQVLANADAAYVEVLVRELQRADRAGELTLKEASLDAPRLADLLLRAAHGAQWGANTAREQREALDELVRVLLRGAGAREPEARPARPKRR